MNTSYEFSANRDSQEFGDAELRIYAHTVPMYDARPWRNVSMTVCGVYPTCAEMQGHTYTSEIDELESKSKDARVVDLSHLCVEGLLPTRLLQL